MSQYDNDVPMFARGRNDDNDSTELRVPIPKKVMGVIDAHWMVRGGSRASVINRVLGEWAALELHAASVTINVTGGNPSAVDSKEARS